MSALFNTKKKKEDKEESKDLKVEETTQEVEEDTFSGSKSFSGSGGTSTHKILKGFYISEKSSLGQASSQYMFRVFKNANKSEIKKEVSKLFNVKVIDVKVLNMPEKRRDLGKHPGSKSGFKKAIVILEKGHVIGQAKP